MLITLSAMCTSHASELVQVAGTTAKLLSEQPDSSGDVWFSVKTTVRNSSSDYRYVSFTLQGIDSDGFEMKSERFRGIVDPSSDMTFTDRTYMNGKNFDSITHWKVGMLKNKVTIEPRIKMLEAVSKSVSDVDSSGDIWYAVRASIQNLSDDTIQKVQIQGVDSDGFELCQVTLDGSIEAGETGSMTDKTYMAYKNFRRVTDWLLVRR